MTTSGPIQSGPAMPDSGAARVMTLAPAAPGKVRGISSAELLGARGELKIQHNGEWYSLRRTRQGKLILTK